MSPPILATWEHKSATDSSATILPDGCRDLLFRARPGQRPVWTLTSLDNQPYNVQIKIGAHLKGYRLHPGTLVDTHELLKSLQSLEYNLPKIEERIDSFCTLSPPIGEAMACVGAPDTKSVHQAAKTLGVSMRTLQRLLMAATGRTPAGWLSLSRARRAARLMPTGASLAEIAYDFGYADQSHMAREIKRWFGISPAKISLDRKLIQQLDQPGFY